MPISVDPNGMPHNAASHHGLHGYFRRKKTQNSKLFLHFQCVSPGVDNVYVDQINIHTLVNVYVDLVVFTRIAGTL